MGDGAAYLEEGEKGNKAKVNRSQSLVIFADRQTEGMAKERGWSSSIFSTLYFVEGERGREGERGERVVEQTDGDGKGKGLYYIRPPIG